MMKKPNIVFFFADQQRWDTCGCYGQKLPVTPNLDRLASEGVRFNNAFTCQPVCGPARACLQTGRYATEVGCYRNAISLPQNVKTLAEYFNEAGYHTDYVGKWHLASDRPNGERYETTAIPAGRMGGYRRWFAADVLEFTSHGYDGYVFDQNGNRHDFIGYRADCITDYAIHCLRSRPNDNPFFLFLSHIEPHHQNDHGVCEGPDGSKARFAGFEPPADLAAVPEGDWQKNYPDYLGQCSSLDYNLGRVIDTLKEQGVWEDTILIYTSDHGCHFRTRADEYKRSCHAASSHIPMIIHGGPFRGGKVIDHMVSLIDLPATLLDCAGITKPEGFQGSSLKELVQAGAKGWQDDIFMQISESQIGRAVRTHDWVYSVRSESYTGFACEKADIYYEDFLYNLKNDPYEQNNLVDTPEFEPVRRDMSQRLLARMAQAGESRPEILPYSKRPN